MHNKNEVTIIEVGPRDGLQNESMFVSTAHKIALIDRLSQTGLRHIEVTSFVSEKAIPQLVDCEAVFQSIQKREGLHFSALIPNVHGLEKALGVGVQEIAIFTAASELFNQRNIHCSIQESINRCVPVVAKAKVHGIRVRAYISCALGCPYAGDTLPERVVEIVAQLLALGVDEISCGDTIGVGTPKQTKALISALATMLPLSQLAMHFHDTYGQAIANICCALEMGVMRFDSAVAGLGGCPYARGASGNVATEDVLYLMHGFGIDTGIDIFKVTAVGDWMCKVLGRRNQSKVANALLANP
jgi:hydroxymethylglutaryl-CoA lyase